MFSESRMKKGKGKRPRDRNQIAKREENQGTKEPAAGKILPGEKVKGKDRSGQKGKRGQWNKVEKDRWKKGDLRGHPFKNSCTFVGEKETESTVAMRQEST